MVLSPPFELKDYEIKSLEQVMVILFIAMILYDMGRNTLHVGCHFRLLGVSDVCENVRLCCERFLQLINV